jgi:hypothetical protein
MADKLQSVTGAVNLVAGTVTFKIRYNKGRAFLYVNYTKGDETTLDFVIEYLVPDIHATSVYKVAALAAGVLAAATYQINGTKKLVYELTNVPQNATSVVLTFVFTGVGGGTPGVAVVDLLDAEKVRI